MATIDLGLTSYEELFMDDSERQNNRLPKIENIPIELIDDFQDHPFQVRFDEEMDRLMDSIKEYGVLVPILIRPIEDRYELVSGHRRKAACEALGLETLPAVVRSMTREEAIITMVDSNIQREHVLPSEKAKAYKMKMDALKHQGKVTSAQVGPKSWSVEQIASESGESRNQVKRYIRLNHLHPEILEMVDQGKMAFNPAVELSYLSALEQKHVLDAMQYEERTPSLAQAIQLKRLSQEGQLDRETTSALLAEDKPNQRSKPSPFFQRVRHYFPQSFDTEQIEELIEMLIENWYKEQRVKCERTK